MILFRFSPYFRGLSLDEIKVQIGEIECDFNQKQSKVYLAYLMRHILIQFSDVEMNKIIDFSFQNILVRIIRKS